MKRDELIFLFLFLCPGAESAQLVGSEILLCTNGFSPDNTTCTTYGVGDCDTGYYDLTPSETSFFATTNGVCARGGYYHLETLPDTATAVYYHGILLGDETTLCTNGYSPDNTTCTTYSSGDCPTGYLDVSPASTSFAAYNSSCASRYVQYDAEDTCGFGLTASTCISFCSSGQFTTGVGGCSVLCGEGATVFRTNTGLRYPLWATKQITPSLNVGFVNGNQCYVNLVPGHADTTAIHVVQENNLYHATK